MAGIICAFGMRFALCRSTVNESSQAYLADSFDLAASLRGRIAATGKGKGAAATRLLLF